MQASNAVLLALVTRTRSAATTLVAALEELRDLALVAEQRGIDLGNLNLAALGIEEGEVDPPALVAVLDTASGIVKGVDGIYKTSLSVRYL